MVNLVNQSLEALTSTFNRPSFWLHVDKISSNCHWPASRACQTVRWVEDCEVLGKGGRVVCEVKGMVETNGSGVGYTGGKG